MDSQLNQRLVKRFAEFFEVSVTIKFFGKIVWSCNFPPKKHLENE